tara:strand:+ start:162 stop:1049 length:888 start_codon:yes stop_codon:yes gene_type:complete
MNEVTEGNPNEVAQETAEDAVFGSPDAFFDALDDEVNGVIQDDVSEPEQVTSQSESPKDDGTKVEESVNDVDYQKRYSDSSREAQRMKAELDNLKPFVPVLEAMKNDSGLVDYVRGYFESGGQIPKNVKDELKLNEDFEFDADEMVNNEESDSRKVIDSIVNKKVQEGIGRVVEAERAQARETGKKLKAKQEAEALMREYNMDQNQFQDFVHDAKEYYNKNGINYKDIMFLMNRDKNNANVANAAKNDMIKQMKTVREIPTSQSSANSTKVNKTQDDAIFESILGLDEGIDNLFG